MYMRKLYGENYRAVREALRESKLEPDGKFSIVRVRAFGNFRVDVRPLVSMGIPYVVCRGVLAREVWQTARAADIGGYALFDYVEG